MNSDAFRENIHQIIAGVSFQRDDLLVISLIVSIAAMMIAIVCLRRSGRGGKDGLPGFDRLTGIQNRVEKLELLLNELKLNGVKQIDQTKGEFQYLKRDIEDIRKILKYAAESKQRKDARAELGTQSAQTSSQPAPVKVEPLQERESKFSRTPTELDIQRYADLIDEEIEESAESRDTPEKKSEKSAPELKLVAERRDPVPSAGPEPLVTRLKKTRFGLFERFKGIFSSAPRLSAEMVEELESVLIGADLGVRTVQTLLSEIKEELKRGSEVTEESLKAMLKLKILTVLENDRPLNEIAAVKRESGPTVILVVGVNGAGKTTTIAKLAKLWSDQGRKVMLVAGDTFRAAAVQQLVTWGERIGVPVVHGADNAKPAAVVFDGMQQAKQAGVDVVIIDTAGRLHNKSNLMAELEGVKNSIIRHQPDAPHEILLVLDGTSGQNALIQAREFNQSVDLSGVVITKLDGTPKGGIVVAISQELKIPIRYIGVGEGMNDLRSFSARDFVEALFDPTGLSAHMEEGELSHNAAVRRRRRT